jgi:N-methylhydantoinase A
MKSAIRVATDVGGTFTDLVFFETNDSGRQLIRTAKVDTTPPNFDKGVLNVLAKGKVDVASVAFFAHGTTVVINALTERKGVKTGLITTEGFRDVLEIARGNRPDFFNLMYEKPKPFVPRRLRREVRGRIDYRGEEMTPLDLSGLPTILESFRSEGVRAIAICLLHAYANPAHEQAVVAEARRLWPDVAMVASHQITREWREYERTNTTVLSAYVQPIAESYLERLERGLDAHGNRAPIYIMQSNCGVDSLAATKAIPITMVESGPASGFWGAAELGRLIGEPNVLALDIGGTTAKCSLIEGGHVKIMTDYWIERSKLSSGYPIMVPVVDVVEIGNGGGSIAWVDDFVKLHVGPQSAGALPGPAAYGRGGAEATTTDANIALGRINKDYFFGGEITVDMNAVDSTLGLVAQKLGVSPIEAARGIVRIANNNMINALKLVSINRGYDPRDFTLVAFGGGGGMHAAALGAELGVKKVVIPRSAPVFSAWGMMMSDLRRDYFVTRLIEIGGAPVSAVAAQLNSLIEEAAGRARAQFAAESISSDRVTLTPFLKCRYQNQEHSVEAPLTYGPVVDATVEDLVSRFHAIYEREYTYRLDAPVEVVGLHLVASAEVGKLRLMALPKTGASLESARKGRRPVDYALEGVREAEIYDGDRLEPGMRFVGPAIVEDAASTVVVHPGQAASLDAYGNIHIENGP